MAGAAGGAASGAGAAGGGATGRGAAAAARGAAGWAGCGAGPEAPKASGVAPGAATGALPSTSSRTLLMRAWVSKGFWMKASARTVLARASSNASNVPASRMTGTPDSAGSALSTSQASYPFFLGITASSRITSGLAALAFATASSPLATTLTA